MLEFSRGANRNVDTWDQNIFQGTTPSCAVRCQQIIMRDYGIQIPQEDLMDYAAQKGWYNPEDGTMTRMRQMLPIMPILQNSRTEKLCVSKRA